MADLMLRMAGRSESGVAKPIKTDEDGKIQVGGELKLSGSSLKESSKTQADAVAGTLTFGAAISHVEIYNADPTNIGTFNVNGFNIKVPPATPWEGKVEGTPRNTVTVTGSTSYIVNRVG